MHPDSLKFSVVTPGAVILLASQKQNVLTTKDVWIKSSVEFRVSQLEKTVKCQ